MRSLVCLSALLTVVLSVAGCGGGPDIDEPVRIQAEASDQLNFYDGSAHAVDVYIYKLDEPTLFESADLEKLLQEGQPVPGGFAIERRNIAPGATAEWNVGATRHERYTHIGVLATFREPKGVQRMTHEWEEKLSVKLDAHSILSFTEYDD
jgi:type VI secretion system VasD/TssJ family lipoprotein